jgi:hypothetical protein
MACDWSSCTVSDPSPRVQCDESPAHSFHLTCYSQAATAVQLAALCSCLSSDCAGFVEEVGGGFRYDGVVDEASRLGFEAAIAALRSPRTGDETVEYEGDHYIGGASFADLVTGEPDDAGEGGEEHPGTAIATCAICWTEVLDSESHRVCTGCGPRLFFHDPACLGNEQCYLCHTELVNPFAPVAGPVTWQTDVTSAIWDQNSAVPQGFNATMCYAAAAATAVRCVNPGSAITVADCMHLYAMSGGTEGDWALAYQSAFAAAQSALQATGNASPTVTQVHQRMQADPDHPQWATALSGAFVWGSPVFPNGTNAQGPYSMQLTDIVNAVQTSNVVLAGNSNHWYVIFGVKVRNGDGKAYLRIYNPMGNGRVDNDYVWSASEFEQYLIVG